MFHTLQSGDKVIIADNSGWIAPAKFLHETPNALVVSYNNELDNKYIDKLNDEFKVFKDVDSAISWILNKLLDSQLCG